MVDLKLVTPSHWRDNVRDDGLRIEHKLGQWVIMPKAGAILSRCPCCNGFLTTLRAAQIVADREYPVNAP